MTGLNPSGQHHTATPGSSYHSKKSPPDLSATIPQKMASQAYEQNPLGISSSTTLNTCPSSKYGHGPLYLALTGGSLKTSSVLKRLSTVIFTLLATFAKQTSQLTRGSKFIYFFRAHWWNQKAVYACIHDKKQIKINSNDFNPSRTQ